MTQTVPCSGRLWTIALCTRFVAICSRSAGEPMVGVDVAGGLDGGAAFFGEGEERLGGLFGDERQVDGFADERPLVGAAEHEQRFGEVDRSGVDGVQALDELAVVAVRILAGHVEQRLRDRQRSAQLVGGVGGEPLLLGDVCLEPREHGVERVGELAELVATARQPDPVRQRSGRGDAGGVGDRVQGSEHPAGEKPPPDETEHQQERQRHDCRLAAEDAPEVRAGGVRTRGQSESLGVKLLVGTYAQQEHPHDGEQQAAGDHEEARRS